MSRSRANISFVLETLANRPHYKPGWAFTRLPYKGNNAHFRVETLDNGSYFAKLCRHNDKVHDICEREQFTSIAAITFRCELRLRLGRIYPNRCFTSKMMTRLLNRIALMNLLDGNTVDQSPKNRHVVFASQLDRVSDLLGFLHWIGDEDRDHRRHTGRS